MNEGDIVVCLDERCLDDTIYFTKGKQYTIIESESYTHTMLVYNNIGGTNYVSKDYFILLSDYREFQLNKILKDEL